MKVVAALDTGTGKVTWTFTSLDPATGQLTTDPLAGLLPPGVEGSTSYFATPKAGIASGTAIAGDASIVFDTNAAIATNVWSNLIDNDAPTASVTSATPGCSSINVAWSGSDAASGIANYDVWVSTDGGDFVPWRAITTDTSGAFTGVVGHTYRFDVQARDLAGNLQSGDRSDAKSAVAPSPCTAGIPGEPLPNPGSPAPGGATPGTALVKPWLKLGKLPAKLKQFALAVPVSCPATETAGCKGKLTLTTIVKAGKKRKTVTLGNATFNVKAGKSATVKLKLAKARCAACGPAR